MTIDFIVGAILAFLAAAYLFAYALCRVSARANYLHDTDQALDLCAHHWSPADDDAVWAMAGGER